MNGRDTFYSTFPFSVIPKWKTIIWPIHWNNCHWLLYIADRDREISFLLDPQNDSLTDNMTRFQLRLNSILLSAHAIADPIEMNSGSLSTYNLPKQMNDFDCGIFICQYAIDYCRNYGTFFAPDTPTIRNEISKALYTKQFIKSKSHPFLNAWMSNTINGLATVSDVEDALNALVKAVSELNVNKFKDYVIRPSKKLKPKKEEITLIRSMYKKNRKLTFESLLQSTHLSSKPSTSTISEHYRRPKPDPIDKSFFNDFKSASNLFDKRPMTAKEIFDTLSNCDYSAPGNDKISFHDLKTVDPDCSFLCKLFNIILTKRIVPKQWKRYRTTLILKAHKENLAHDISSWRPIAVLDTSYRLFTKILNTRLTSWIQNGNLINNCQKAILASDGCTEHNSYINSLKQYAIASNSYLHLCWIDIADAFPSVPHELIWHTLHMLGLDSDIIALFSELYNGISTSYHCEKDETDYIPVNCGVRQGCPLSMNLFCLAIDFILRSDNELAEVIGMHGSKISTLAYADDIVLISSNFDNLKTRLDTVVTSLMKIGLRIKPAKCGYWHNGNNQTERLSIYNETIPLVTNTNEYMYLGVPFGSPKQTIDDTMNSIIRDYKCVVHSNLHPAQKLECYKLFLHSRLNFHLKNRTLLMRPLGTRTWTDGNGELQIGFDNQIRKLHMEIARLRGTQSHTFRILYAPVSVGGLGLVQIYDDYLVQKVVKAFKTLNSSDAQFKEIMQKDLLYHYQKKVPQGFDSNPEKSMRWLSGDSSPEIVSDHPKSRFSTWWIDTRHACMTLRKSFKIDCKFRFRDNEVLLDIGCNGDSTTFSNKNKLELTKFLHECFQVFHFKEWSSLEKQGTITKALELDERSNKMMMDTSLPPNIWEFAIKARINNLPLNCQAHRALQDLPTKCRWCNEEPETQAHIYNHCSVMKTAKNTKHNGVLKIVWDFLVEENFDVLIDSVIPNSDSNLRPDIVIYCGKYIHILDVKVPYDNPVNFDCERNLAYEKYKALCDNLSRKTKHTLTFGVLVVGCLGSWDPKNDKALSKFLTKSQIASLVKKMTGEAIWQSFNIFRNHVGLGSEQRQITSKG